MVRGDTQNDISQAHRLRSVEKKLVGKMLLGELQKSIVSFDEVGSHDNAVIIAIGVITLDIGVRLIWRRNAGNHVVFPEQKRSSERVALTPRLVIL